MSIKPGYYQHFEGNVYLVLGVAKHTETEEELVIYYSLDGIWAQPASMFNALIEHEGKTVSRFTFLSADYHEAEELLRSTDG
jgi:hypothetical protein